MDAPQEQQPVLLTQKQQERDGGGVIRIASSQDVRLAWEGALNRVYPTLSKVAARLLMLHATSCSSERMWSLLRWIYSDQRLLLATGKAEKLLYIAVTKQLERRQEDVADADVLLAALLEEEIE